ncbi:sulfatase [Coniochaeta ligniaria NRRL 30616]|uniref:Sulfatase n=1 Tax=Coniochaeta ligniaria NRRL 30616 TaxID=1408157 RepID=A0A1J7JX56_9PEZI|nr:sulfatase [Coniochaeta ligniaria NRRL 30616]
MVQHPPYRIPHVPVPSLPHRPNMIIFMPDQLRYDSLSVTNPSSPIRTPHLDAFAARGTLFANCFVQASVCAQSRCSMFTGLYPHVAGHRSLENLIKAHEPNLFRSLKEEGGYHVACLAPRGDTFAPRVTELSVSEYGFLEGPGWTPRFGGQEPEDKDDIWGRLFYKGLRNAGEEADYDDAVVRSALKWLERPPRDKPWVLFLPLLFPHCPFQVEEPWFSMYERGDMPPPSRVEDKTGYEPRYMKVLREQYGTHRATPEIWAEVMATYYGMISRLDDQFGRVIKKVDELGYWDNTVTMFFTDHGEYLGDHGLIEKWPSGLSESLVREPLIIAGGGLPAGVVYDEMTEMVDLIPTVFQMAGIDEHFPHCGKPWGEILVKGGKEEDGRAIEHKKYAFSEGGFLLSEEPLLEQAPYPYDIKAALQHQDTKLVGKAVSARSKDWTYVYRLYEPPELYDRKNDPQELHNLADLPEHAAVRAKMESDILRWLMETSDFLPFQKDPRFPNVDLESPSSQWEKRAP